jgi:hypothetical protein
LPIEIGEVGGRCIRQSNSRKPGADKRKTNLRTGPGVRQTPEIAAGLERPVGACIKLLNLKAVTADKIGDPSRHWDASNFACEEAGDDIGARASSRQTLEPSRSVCARLGHHKAKDGA